MLMHCRAFACALYLLLALGSLPGVGARTAEAQVLSARLSQPAPDAARLSVPASPASVPSTDLLRRPDADQGPDLPEEIEALMELRSFMKDAVTLEYQGHSLSLDPLGRSCTITVQLGKLFR